MARAIQLARVVVVEEPDTGSARKYLRRWGDEKIEGLVHVSLFYSAERIMNLFLVDIDEKRMVNISLAQSILQRS